MTYFDIILNYQVPLSGIDIDAGVDLRMSNISYSGGLSEQQIYFSDHYIIPIPMLHLAAEYADGSGDLAIGAEVNGLPMDMNSYIYDFSIYSKYFLPLPTRAFRIGLEWGYHQYAAKTDGQILWVTLDNIRNIEMTNSGFYMGITSSF